MNIQTSLRELQQRQPHIGLFGGAYSFHGHTLVATTDGVGAKGSIAFALGGETHAAMGRDLVHHCVNDLLACGAKPLFFLDTLSMHAFDADVFASILRGIESACLSHDIVLLGGETAIMPSLYKESEYDLVGTMIGEQQSSMSGVCCGDLVVGLPSTGLHTNGYTIALNVLDDSYWDVLLQPHRSYAYIDDFSFVHAAAHITGGGLLGNVSRVVPRGLSAAIRKGTWPVPDIFTVLASRTDDPFSVFNMGIGFVLILSACAVAALSYEHYVIGVIDDYKQTTARFV
jgi:phosphoribosylformylglycinamidine cyclo-ligase